MKFDELPPESRVWVYTSNRVFSDLETQEINEKLTLFMNTWAAHGSSLHGAANVISNRFILLVVDEASVGASGCSIDTSVGFIKSLENQYSTSLFDRMLIVVEKDGKQKDIHFSELNSYKGWFMYNPLIKNLKDYRENWIIPVESSVFV